MRIIRVPSEGLRPNALPIAREARSGQQAALGGDLRELLDALHIDRAVLAGFDWGGRAAGVVSALWPERVLALLMSHGYSIANSSRRTKSAPPEQEGWRWYQFYFQTERGRAGLTANRRKLLWQQWSPGWHFDEATFDRTAVSFENPDFVPVVIHAYRHARPPTSW